VSRGAPLPPYIKDQGGGSGWPREGTPGRSPTPTESRTPPFHVGVGEERGGERGRKERGASPPFLVQVGHGRGGARGCPLAASPLPPIGPMRPNSLRGVPVTPRYSGIYPITPGTIPVSEYSHPIYQSSCIDHFETPRYVRDHI
jgi:hypothetical protein